MILKRHFFYLKIRQLLVHSLTTLHRKMKKCLNDEKMNISLPVIFQVKSWKISHWPGTCPDAREVGRGVCAYCMRLDKKCYPVWQWHAYCRWYHYLLDHGFEVLAKLHKNNALSFSWKLWNVSKENKLPILSCNWVRTQLTDSRHPNCPCFAML